MDKRVRTHWEDCWRYSRHHACCVARVGRLEREVEVRKEQLATQVTALTEMERQVHTLREELVECQKDLAFEEQVTRHKDDAIDVLNVELSECREELAAWQLRAHQVRDSVAQEIRDAIREESAPLGRKGGK